MDIYRNQPHGLSVLQAIRKYGARKTPAAEESTAPPREVHNDRRLQPDRRRAQREFPGADRRTRRSRRSPGLLQSRTMQPASLEGRRGRRISTRA